MINDPLALTMGIIFIASAIALASLLWAHKEALLPKYKKSLSQHFGVDLSIPRESFSPSAIAYCSK